MPPQNLEKERPFGLKELNMPRGITSNNSNEELVSSTGDNTVEEISEPTIRDVKASEWVTMFILCFVNLINYMDRFTLAGILDDIQKHYNIGNDMAGLLQTSFILSYMVFAPLFGYLGDRYSRKYIMAFGVALWSLTTLLGSFMNVFGWFVVFRALVGIGEASYSTIAPTIISDLFIKGVRSKMLAMFYFAIPVGSGLGYIVGSETAKALGSWQWALRVTPGLGLIAVILLLAILKDPERGASEGSSLTTTSWKEDLKELTKNPSFILSSAGFTCVAFVAGALAWWGPKFIFMGIRLQQDDAQLNDLSFLFGIVTMLSGVVGLSLGAVLSGTLGRRFRRADPLICGAGLFLSAPFIVGASFSVTYNTTLCYVLLFFGQVTLNLNWAIVCDILLYVVLPTRRSTAEGVQLLVAHAFGDAGSPYLIGLISDWLASAMKGADTITASALTNSSDPVSAALTRSAATQDDYIAFRALQYALFTTCFVEILGGIFFLINAVYIVKDRQKVERAVKKSDADLGDDRQRLPRLSDAGFS